MAASPRLSPPASPRSLEPGEEEEEEAVGGGVGLVHQAVLDNSPTKLEQLIAADCPLDERDAHSLTPLHLAVSLGRLELAKLLLSAGASPHSRTGNSAAPLTLDLQRLSLKL